MSIGPVNPNNPFQSSNPLGGQPPEDDKHKADQIYDEAKAAYKNYLNAYEEYTARPPQMSLEQFQDATRAYQDKLQQVRQDLQDSGLSAKYPDFVKNMDGQLQSMEQLLNSSMNGSVDMEALHHQEHKIYEEMKSFWHHGK